MTDVNRSRSASRAGSRRTSTCSSRRSATSRCSRPGSTSSSWSWAGQPADRLPRRPVRGVLLPGQGQHARQPDDRRRARRAHPRRRDVDAAAEHAALAAAPRGRLDRPRRRAGTRGGDAGEVPVVLPGLQQPGARGRVAGARHRRRPPAGVSGVLQRREGAHLPELRHPAPRQGYGPSSTSTRTSCRRVAGARRGLRWRRLALAAGRLRARGHDHGRRDRVPADRPECWDPPMRLADMDADGVDVQVVSPTPVFFCYERPADQAVKVARIFNDLTLECLPAARLVPFCQVPLQDPDAACASWTAAWPPATRGSRSATTSATATSTTRVSCRSCSTARRSAPRSSSTRGTCPAGRGSTGGWPAG